jgi:sterol 3beta-glucosyltransferase
MYTGNIQNIIREQDDITTGHLLVDPEEEPSATSPETAAAVSASLLPPSDLPLENSPNKDDADSETYHSDDDASDLEEIPDIDDSGSSSNNNTPLPSKKHPTLFELSVEKKLKINSTSSSSKDAQNRAIALTDKLRKSFNIDENDTFIADYPCWLLKDVLLQGHLYLTASHLMFFAFLPKTDKDKPSLTGNLSMEVLPSRRLVRYYTVLQRNTLSLYNKSTDLYFPTLTIDLKNVIRVEIVGDSFNLRNKGTWIKILTESKSYKLQADSKHAARSWIGLLRKNVFASKNEGDEVTIKFPLQNILSIERNQIFESTETLKLKVLENLKSFVYDDYFFMFFKYGPQAYSTIDATMKNSLNSDVVDDVIDSTSKLRIDQQKQNQNKNKTRSTPLSPLRHVFRSGNATPSPIPDDDDDDESTQTIEKVVTKGEPPAADVTSSSSSSSFPASTLNSARQTLNKLTPKMFKSATSMWASNPRHYVDSNQLGEQDEFLAPLEERGPATKRFQDHFSLPDSHELVSSYYAYLHKNLPIYGKIYLSSTEICFRSLLPGTNTKMILPLSDVENVYREKGFRFGYHGLVLVISGHEELFLEFSWSGARDDCELIMLKLLDKMETTDGDNVGDNNNGNDNDNNNNDDDNETLANSTRDLETAKIRLFEENIYNESGLDVPVIIEDHPLLKTTLKPSKSYKFGLLTIGSRGDVQPYIALGLGLLKENHSVTIITHIEFKEWIERVGLKFKEIAGNPTELMSLMVEHGSMNVGLIKEASSKFRGWITDLLKTSWEACREDCDILIESPSAMAGIHIAEALQIPYFRAFTMPWTRTRAYPHAFIVPDQKKGGSYNYLTHVLFENVFWKGTSSQINKWRTETLKLPKTNLDLLQQGKVPFLYNVSPTVMPPPVDYNDWVRVTGYWFLDESNTYEPNPKLLEFIETARKLEKKLVYIGFGSIVVSNPKELTKAVVEAVKDAGVYCILNKGWSERLNDPTGSQVEVPLPPEIYNSGSIPHDWLFPQIDAAVHHGGSGTTGATLRFGLPTIIKPFFGDQFFYANRVEDIGAGIGLKKLNVKSLSRALKEVTTNSRMIAKAKDIGERITKENGVKVAINDIYTELEYAREIMVKKRRVVLNKDDEEIIDEDNSKDIGSFADLELIRKEIGSEDSSSELKVDDDDDTKDSWFLV